jgi:hypothetical protein
MNTIYINNSNKNEVIVCLPSSTDKNVEYIKFSNVSETLHMSPDILANSYTNLLDIIHGTDTIWGHKDGGLYKLTDVFISDILAERHILIPAVIYEPYSIREDIVFKDIPYIRTIAHFLNSFTYIPEHNVK